MPPETLQARHLRHLALTGFVLPIRSQLLTTAVGLVTLALTVGHPHNLLPSQYSAPMAFIHATIGDSLDQLFISRPRPRCGDTTHAYAKPDTHHTS